MSKKTREMGLINSAVGGGPDFVFTGDDEGQTIAVEATVLTAGTPCSSSAIETFPLPSNEQPSQMIDVSVMIWAKEPNGALRIGADDKPYEIPNPNAQSKLALRITTALANKKKQYEKWVGQNIVNPKNPFVLAISAAQLDYDSGRMTTLNEFESALYGKGLQIIALDKETRKSISQQERQYEAREKIDNLAGSSVELALFLRDEYQFLTAVWLIEDTLFNEKESALLINPNARAALPENFLPQVNKLTYNEGRITAHNIPRATRFLGGRQSPYI